MVLDRLTPGVPGVLSGSLVIAGAAITTGTAAAILGGFEQPQTAAGWAALLGMVLTATVLGFALFVAGLKRTGPQVASILSTFEPVGTLALAALVLGERLDALQWSGATLILVAAFVLAASPAHGAAS
jgi:drug/metabolite transporter (DMT)-like permease